MATKKQQAEYRKSQAKSKLAWGIAFFFAIVWLVIALVPFLFMVISGLLSTVDSNLCAAASLTTDWMTGEGADNIRASRRVMLALLLALGNVSFALYDRALAVLTRCYRTVWRKKLKFFH